MNTDAGATIIKFRFLWGLIFGSEPVHVTMVGETGENLCNNCPADAFGFVLG